jgi:hypothetical protein
MCKKLTKKKECAFSFVVYTPTSFPFSLRMHTNHTAAPVFTDATSQQLLGVRVTSFIAFAVFGVASVIFPAIYLANRTHLKSSIVRFSLAVGLLSLGWLVAGLNNFMWNGGSVARIVLNALTWYFTLVQVPEFYQVGDAIYRQSYDAVVRVCILVLALGVLGTEPARFVSLVMVLPIAIVVVLSASVWANDRMSVAAPASTLSNITPYCCPGAGGPSIGLKHIISVCFALLGVYTLICETLSVEYSGAVSLTIEFALMLVAHAAVVLFWLCFAFGLNEEGGSAAAAQQSPNGSSSDVAGLPDTLSDSLLHSDSTIQSDRPKTSSAMSGAF